ncbi:hypothetical protein [Brachybacterium alimentarium]|uniref:hypothetical protein n=1 Tax=Brachybacterium alimentarium TaxID=47845 RepID=UPI000DF15D32|nr:hypothetical protein [Brachybacterium alimentarium]RCS84811.1 hypothetical protein CIK67_09130 [Brachybacterium alimentarium]RCS92156.1 hypothetical protein CIK69_04565 [Brachybacterium alimentarium]
MNAESTGTATTPPHDRTGYGDRAEVAGMIVGALAGVCNLLGPNISVNAPDRMLITAVHLDTGDVEQLTRLGIAPVLAPGDHIVFGDLAGTMHAVERA